MNLEVIKKAKNFARNIGLFKTKNFENFLEDESTLDFIYYCNKYVLPFSLQDPNLRLFEKESAGQPFICKPDNVSYIFSAFALSGGSGVIRKILRSESEEVAKVVFHEDCHDTFNLPRHLDEAVAILIESAGVSLFLGESKDEILERLFSIIQGGVSNCFNCRDEFNLLIQALRFGKISENRFDIERDEILKKYGYTNQIEVAIDNSYYYYFPLVAKLFCFMDHDLKSFIRFFKNFPFCDVNFTDKSAQFEEIRKREIKAEKFIKEFIK